MMNLPFSIECLVQKHGNQHALTLLSWLTKHQSVVFHSQHFTIPSSHHAVSAAVDAEKLTKWRSHA